MSDEDFIIFIMNQIAGNRRNSPDEYESLTETQRAHYQINKKAINRIKYYVTKQAKKEEINIYE